MCLNLVTGSVEGRRGEAKSSRGRKDLIEYQVDES